MAINFPSSPVQGQVYEFGDYVYTFDGVKWTSVLKYGLAAAKVSSETPPPNPEAGLMWYVPSTGESYIWYDDGDSGQWIQENPSIGAVAHRFLEGINEPGSHEASAIRTATGISVQEFADSFALKIFQAPTDGGLTEIQTRTVDAGEVYEVRKTSDNSLATIYSNAAGTTEIVQNGTSNVSGSDGVVSFYIEDTFDELKVEAESGVANFKNNVFIQQNTRENGIGVWDADTTYSTDGMAKGSDGQVYVSVLEQSYNNPVSDDGTNWFKMLPNLEFNVLRYGYILNPVVAINAAINAANASGGGKVIIPFTGGQDIDSPIVPKANVRVIQDDNEILTYTVPKNGNIITHGINDFTWVGGQHVGGAVSDTETLFIINKGSQRCLIAPKKVSGFRNKCVDITGGASFNVIHKGEYEGAIGPTGGAISIFGAGVDRPDNNIIFEPYCHNCRAGVSVQGGYYNRVIRPIVEDATLWGVGCDGVITNSGDGARYTYIEHPILVRCGRLAPTALGALYFGNGSSWNITVNPVLIDSTGDAVQTSGGVGYQPFGNRILFPVVTGGARYGINISNCPSAEVISPDVDGTADTGVYLFYSPDSNVDGGESRNCGQAGIQVQTKNCVVTKFYSHDNNYGIRNEFAGGADSAEPNKFIDCRAEDNTTADVVRNAGAVIVRTKGYENRNKGTATIANGTRTIVVPHGLDYTPSADDIHVTPTSNPTSLNGFWVAGIDGTKFNINSSDTATNDVGFAWEVDQN